MRESVVQPSIKSHSAAISSCEKGAQWVQALVLLRSACLCALRLDATIFNATMSACEKGTRWDVALQLLRSMDLYYKVQPNVISFSAGLSACEKISRWQEALAVGRRAMDGWVLPNL
eukprot:CAMPEP_0179194536 /NCGR_PEP_ID=MMETSP0796-20121207/96687_1 /TAXON_ID=73915 /ORGANISM="Pyrodinium bahamense, Strain pbaha01" /LENGTH=116 /DNA_ID=CAMNT_0020898863 /DNA_START=118 /DNA_END=465 /DNA_ORIENTATION=+